MRQKKRQATSKKTLYVAVVMGQDGLTVSKRARGDFSALVSESESVAVERAMKAKQVWEEDTTRNYGPYDVYVGTLAKKVVVPETSYTMEAL